MRKITNDCIEMKSLIINLSNDELEQLKLDVLLGEEAEALEKLIPTEKEILMAEIELSTIMLLLEMGVI